MNRYERHLEKAKEWTLQKLRKKTATEFQRMVRAEAGARESHVFCVAGGSLDRKWSGLGRVVCVTCGREGAWNESKGLGSPGMDAGHFMSRKHNILVFEEINCHPQCTHCNRILYGNLGDYELYMRLVYGEEVCGHLQWLARNGSKKFTREELVTKRLEFIDRVKIAVHRMEMN